MVNLKAVRELWERVKLEIILGFPGAPRSVWLRKAFAVFRRRVGFLMGR